MEAATHRQQTRPLGAVMSAEEGEDECRGACRSSPGALRTPSLETTFPQVPQSCRGAFGMGLHIEKGVRGPRSTTGTITSTARGYHEGIRV